LVAGGNHPAHVRAAARGRRLVAAIFRSPIWMALNRGELTQDEAAAS
jgi:hypothetical protein